MNHYRRLLDKVNVFALPHHGSRANFSLALFDAMPNASQFIAAAGPNSYDHPSEYVIRAVRAAGRTFVHVDEHEHADLMWRHAI
jgi:beta-lactamase superfamily II metal-dependent hydrolase